MLEVQPAEDPAPEFIHIFGNCFLVSTTTNSSLQEAKNSVTSCLTVSLARTHDSVETAAVVLLMHRYEGGLVTELEGDLTQHAERLLLKTVSVVPLHTFDLLTLMNIKAITRHLK